MHIPFCAKRREPSCPQSRCAHTHLSTHSRCRKSSSVLRGVRLGLWSAIVCLKRRRVSGDRLIGERGRIELEVLCAAAAIWGALSVAVLRHCGGESSAERGRRVFGSIREVRYARCLIDVVLWVPSDSRWIITSRNREAGSARCVARGQI